MMAWFTALSLGRKLGVILALLAVVAAIIWGINAWLDSIRESGRNEVRAEWAAEKAGMAQAQATFQTSLTAALTPQFDRLAAKIGTIDTEAAQINVRLPQAIAAAPRYADPNCSLTPSVLAEVNAARSLSRETPQ